jgi:hypothetical protein
MKIYGGLNAILGTFFLVVAIAYGLVTDFREPVGFAAVLLLAAMMYLVAFFLRGVAKRLGTRPEEVEDAPSEAEAGEQGFFPASSWWPLIVSLVIWLAILGIIFSWWIFAVAAVGAMLAAAGWGMEFSLGRFKH